MSNNITVSARSIPNTYIILGILSYSIPVESLRGVNINKSE
jgi:hypothetical protein